MVSWAAMATSRRVDVVGQALAHEDGAVAGQRAARGGELGVQ
jgi:hypothetical protein